MKKKKSGTHSAEILNWREAVRNRPAMYTGSTQIQGFEHLLRDFFASFFKYVDAGNFALKLPVVFFEAEHISLEILGKQSGIFRFEKPNRKIPANISENLTFGFDLAILNALSLNYEFRLFDQNHALLLKQIYQQGILQNGIVEETEYSFDTMEIRFTLDSEIWEEFEINPYFFAEIIKELAFLNEDKTFELKYSIGGEDCRIIYKFPNGLKDLVQINGTRGWGSLIYLTELEYKSEDFSAEICFSFHDYSVNEPFFKSFVNNHYTHEGGTHVKGLLSGIGKALKKFIKEQKPDDFFVITDRTILSSLVGAIHLKLKHPSFEGAVKNKLNNPQIVEPISEFVFKKFYEKLENHPEAAIYLIRHKFAEIHWNNKWLKRL